MKVTSSTLASSFGKALKISEFARVVEMPLDFAAGLGPELSHQGVQNAQQVEIVAGCWNLVEYRLEERSTAISDGCHRVGDDENAKGRTSDDDKLIGLHQHFEMAAQGCVAAEDASDGDEQANAEVQDFAPAWNPTPTWSARLTPSCQAEGSASDKPHAQFSPGTVSACAVPYRKAHAEWALCRGIGSGRP